MAGKPFIESMPDVGIRIPSGLHVHGGIVLDPLIIDIIPAVFRIQKSTPVIRILFTPGRDRLMVLKRRVIIPFSFQFRKRLIQQEPDIVDTLVNAFVQRRITDVCQHVPRHALSCPVQ